MQGNIRYMYSLEIVIVARSLRSLVKIQSNLTSDPTRSQIQNMSPPYRIMNARWICFRLGYSFRATAASEGRGEVCHNPTVWHIRTLKYSHQPEQPEHISNCLLTKAYSLSIVFINSYISSQCSATCGPTSLTKLGNNSKYMQGNIRFMYSVETVKMLARSARS